MQDNRADIRASSRPKTYIRRAGRSSSRGSRPACILSQPRSGTCATSPSGRWKPSPRPTSSPARTPGSHGRLLDHYGIATPLTPYHEHNAEAARPKLLGRLAQGETVALVSDAGTPLVSDPGFKLVRAAREAGHPVIAAPGPSALLAALTSSGLPTDRFFFEGFLSAKDGQRKTRIAELARIPATLILYESGARIARTLAALAEGLGARQAAVCRELTKLHEEVRRGNLSLLATQYAEGAETRGEFTVVVEPPSADAAMPDAERSRCVAAPRLAECVGQGRGQRRRRGDRTAAAGNLPARTGSWR